MASDPENPLDFEAAFEAGKQAGATIERWDGKCPYNHRKLRAAWSDGFSIAWINAANDGLARND